MVLRPTDLVVRAFDGSKRAVFGEVELPVKIRPEVFMSVFYVMDIPRLNEATMEDETHEDV